MKQSRIGLNQCLFLTLMISGGAHAQDMGISMVSAPMTGVGSYGGGGTMTGVAAMAPSYSNIGSPMENLANNSMATNIALYQNTANNVSNQIMATQQATTAYDVGVQSMQAHALAVPETFGISSVANAPSMNTTYMANMAGNYTAQLAGINTNAVNTQGMIDAQWGAQTSLNYQIMLGQSAAVDAGNRNYAQAYDQAYFGGMMAANAPYPGSWGTENVSGGVGAGGFNMYGAGNYGYDGDGMMNTYGFSGSNVGGYDVGGGPSNGAFSINNAAAYNDAGNPWAPTRSSTIQVADLQTPGYDMNVPGGILIDMQGRPLATPTDPILGFGANRVYTDSPLVTSALFGPYQDSTLRLNQASEAQRTGDINLALGSTINDNSAIQGNRIAAGNAINGAAWSLDASSFRGQSAATVYDQAQSQINSANLNNNYMLGSMQRAYPGIGPGAPAANPNPSRISF